MHINPSSKYMKIAVECNYNSGYTVDDYQRGDVGVP